MPNALFPSYFQIPTFPSTWYHPVYASRVIQNATQFATLDSSWSPSAGLADMRRTEIEAQLAINHAFDVRNNAIMDAAIAGPPATPDTVPPRAGSNAINQYSASWQRVLDGFIPDVEPAAFDASATEKAPAETRPGVPNKTDQGQAQAQHKPDQAHKTATHK